MFKLFYSVSFFCLIRFFVMCPKSVMYGEIVEKFKETIQRLSYIEKKALKVHRPAVNSCFSSLRDGATDVHNHTQQ